MQYILSEEEYKELQLKREHEISLSKSKLQKLCTKIADNMPVRVKWRGEDQPWGCILTSEEEWYCDNCPVQAICPNEYKHWSK